MTKIQLIQGDITEMDCDAIVNCANTSLLGGSGLDGIVHRKGGKSILEECEKIRNKQGGCKVSEAVITSGGNLKCKYIIHAVGPTWNGGNSNEESLLVDTYRNCLHLAEKNIIKTIAFPNISTGRYKFPSKTAAKIAIQTINDYLSFENSIDIIILVCFDGANYEACNKLINP